MIWYYLVPSLFLMFVNVAANEVIRFTRKKDNSTAAAIASIAAPTSDFFIVMLIAVILIIWEFDSWRGELLEPYRSYLNHAADAIGYCMLAVTFFNFYFMVEWVGHCLATIITKGCIIAQICLSSGFSIYYLGRLVYGVSSRSGPGYAIVILSIFSTVVLAPLLWWCLIYVTRKRAGMLTEWYITEIVGRWNSAEAVKYMKSEDAFRNLALNFRKNKQTWGDLVSIDKGLSICMISFSFFPLGKFRIMACYTCKFANKEKTVSINGSFTWRKGFVVEKMAMHQLPCFLID